MAGCGWCSASGTEDYAEHFAININGDGDLFGLAWGENIGWISLGHVVHCLAVGRCVSGDYDGDGDVDPDDDVGLDLCPTGPGATVGAGRA